jgi:hypothetical protein
MAGWTEIRVLPGGKIEAEGHDFEGGACETDALMRLLREVATVTSHTRKPDAYRRARARERGRERSRG